MLTFDLYTEVNNCDTKSISYRSFGFIKRYFQFDANSCLNKFQNSKYILL